MKVLFIHKTCGRGGVTTGIRKKYIGLKSLGIESDFLFLHDTGGKDTFSDTGMRLFQASDNEAIGNIIASNEYTHISSIDCPEVSNVLSTLSGKTKTSLRGPHTES